MQVDTIGNATLIVYENNKPLLSTDPWFDDASAYFGSWRLSHEFPIEQRNSVEESKYIFISHFHPDHLNLFSLRNCKKSIILLAQHYGSRVEEELRHIGFKVITLPSRKWVSIGNKTKIMIFNNELQDSALLIEITDDRGEKSIFLNLNDTGGIGFEKEVASISKKYKNSFYLQLHCWGDADMINLFNSKGNRIDPIAGKKFPVGRDIKAGMKRYNSNIAIPFSCHHQYQRRDSYWANEYVTPVEKMGEGFVQDKSHLLLPAFQKIYLKNGGFSFENINPKKLEISPIDESKFGDNWNDQLNQSQLNQCRDYFNSIKNLFYNFNLISIEVGGKTYPMLKSKNGFTKLKFSVPKSSLLKAIRKEIFDDLLIGNFMKTQIINGNSLYDPDFTLTVAKYSDNGRVKTQDELKKYFNYYNHKRSYKDKLMQKFRYLFNKLRIIIGTDNILKLKYILRK